MIYLKMTIANRANTMPSYNANKYNRDPVYRQDFFLCNRYKNRIQLHMVRAQEKRSLSINYHIVKTRDTISVA